MSLKSSALRLKFEALALPGVSSLIRARTSCRGVIFALNRVLPGKPAAFAPSAAKQVTPDFLGFFIERVRQLGLETVSLDEGLRRIESDTREKPFAVLTFDGAYKDNLIHALPILRHHECPFTLYVPTALADGLGELWPLALEDIVAGREGIAVDTGSGTEFIDTRTPAEKRQAYDLLRWRLSQMPEAKRVAAVREFARHYGYDLARQCRDLVMNWSELKVFAGEPLCTIGANTVHGYELARLSEAEARSEIDESLRVIRAQFGIEPRHFSFPIGTAAAAGPREFALAAALGLRSAVTTRPGGLYTHDRDRLTALPRVSLNGLFQARRYVDVFATGAVFSSRADALGQVVWTVAPVPGSPPP